jgi:arylsulfatase A-like enzyme
MAACGPGRPDRSPGANFEPLLPVQAGLNVIVVSFDALRVDALGVYGNSREPTPNMDRFAESSFVFTEAYSAAPTTPTSFAAAWSGFLPSRVFRGWRLLAPSTLASRFAQAGYRTQAFINNVQLTPERGFDIGFDGYDWRRNDPDEEVLEAAGAWLEEDRVGPFFLWVHFLAPLAPYRHRPEAAHLYREASTGRFSATTGHEFDASGPEEVARIWELYLGEVWYADRLFGELIGRLRELGLLDSSIVILTSDHGEEFAEHGGFQHGRLYEEHLRIPLIIRHPQRSGGTIEERVRNVDLMPTVLHAVDEPVREALDGHVIRPPSSRPPRPVVGIAMTGDRQWVSLLVGSRKVIVPCGAPERAEMYDLSSDPGERRDLARERPADVRELARTLQVLMGGDPCTVAARAA